MWYGSVVFRQGRSRPWLAYHFNKRCWNRRFRIRSGHREGRGVFFRRKDGFVPRAMVTLLRRHCRSLHGQNQTGQTRDSTLVLTLAKPSLSW